MTVEYRDPHPAFVNTFSNLDGVSVNIVTGLWNYLAYGFPPGSFLHAVIIDSFTRTMMSADYSWDHVGFKNLSLWLCSSAPAQAWGSPDAMAGWVKLSNEERRDIMIQYKLRPGVIEVLKGAAIA